MERQSDFIILCDFDGTITRKCLCDFLYSEFATCGLKYSDLWAEGKIGTPEEIESSFQFIHASREEMERALSTIEVVPGFPEFYHFCSDNQLELRIVSDGLEWAIRNVLARVGVRDIRVMANQIHFEPQGFRFEFPYYNPNAGQTGVCKRDIVESFKDRGKQVVMIGDGRTDFDASLTADFVFARDELWNFCQSHQLRSAQYKDFFDILKVFQDPEKDF